MKEEFDEITDAHCLALAQRGALKCVRILLVPLFCILQIQRLRQREAVRMGQQILRTLLMSDAAWPTGRREGRASARWMGEHQGARVASSVVRMFCRSACLALLHALRTLLSFEVIYREATLMQWRELSFVNGRAGSAHDELDWPVATAG